MSMIQPPSQIKWFNPTSQNAQDVAKAMLAYDVKCVIHGWPMPRSQEADDPEYLKIIQNTIQCMVSPEEFASKTHYQNLKVLQAQIKTLLPKESPPSSSAAPVQSPGDLGKAFEIKKPDASKEKQITDQLEIALGYLDSMGRAFPVTSDQAKKQELGIKQQILEEYVMHLDELAKYPKKALILGEKVQALFTNSECEWSQLGLSGKTKTLGWERLDILLEAIKYYAKEHQIRLP